MFKARGRRHSILLNRVSRQSGNKFLYQTKITVTMSPIIILEKYQLLILVILVKNGFGSLLISQIRLE